MANLDLALATRELQMLVGARFRKFSQLSEHVYRLDLYRGKNYSIIIDFPTRVHLTDKNWGNATEPDNFTMLVRKRLEGCGVEKIEQLNFDRILQIQFEQGYALVIELIAPGNVILLKDGAIINAVNKVEYDTRIVKPREVYKTPATEKIAPSELTAEMLLKEKGKLMTVLAAKINLSPTYLRGACERAGVKPDAELDKLVNSQILDVVAELNNLTAKLNAGATATSYTSTAPAPTGKQLWEILDEYYSTNLPTAKPVENKAMKKLENRLAIQLKTIDDLQQKANEAREKGEWLKTNHELVEEVLTTADENRKDLKKAKSAVEKIMTANGAGKLAELTDKEIILETN